MPSDTCDEALNHLHSMAGAYYRDSPEADGYRDVATIAAAAIAITSSIDRLTKEVAALANDISSIAARMPS